MSEAKLLVLLDQIVPNAGYFAVKGHDMTFDIFNQIWTNMSKIAYLKDL